ncbi:MAG: D-glycero-beta-D-manno-heptose-7-phosphate kinase [Elusimicrobiales bacterium]|jgi:D-beta-D-heptose 7-phosphate kinase/D-beta-D-heptose 1-phosphate adenosyltransferase
MDNAAFSRLRGIINDFSSKRVAVLGDVMLDRYIRGTVRRMSPEAPVPIVKVREERIVAGGSGNVAANLAALGAIPALISITGNDGAARELSGILEAEGVETGSLISDPSIFTIEKTRVVAEHQQVVRFDREPELKLTPSMQRSVLNALDLQLKAGAGALILSDYGKGLLTPAVIGAAVKLAGGRGVPVFVDPKTEHFARYKKVTCLTPNTMEAWQGMRLIQKDGQDAVEDLGRKIVRTLGCRSLLITQGEHGMTLFNNAGGRMKVLHIPTKAREVYDVTGAGDTVISTLALATAAGAALEDAALISNFAAGIVVGKLGTASVGKEELLDNIRSWTKTA